MLLYYMAWVMWLVGLSTELNMKISPNLFIVFHYTSAKYDLIFGLII